MFLSYNRSFVFIFVTTFCFCVSADAYDDSKVRIKKTVHSEQNSAMGDPMTITWSIVPDGTKMPDYKLQSGMKKTSNFIAMMDEFYGAGDGDDPSDLMLRPWFKILKKAFNKYGSKTGLTYIYEPNDSGVTFKYTSSKGVKGVMGDVRIGGLKLYNTGDLRAYSGYPGNAGYAPSIVFNTDHPLFKVARNIDFLLVHENMHNVGIGHVLVNANPSLTAVASMGGGSGNGPQFDDLLGLHLRYGDFHEKNGGNDTQGNAVDLGSFDGSGRLGVGFDARSLKVKSNQTDFVSIDGTTDVDFYKFTVTESNVAVITLSPRGPTFEYILENEGRRSKKIDASNLSDLSFSLINSKGRKVDVNKATKGEKEVYSINLSADEYFIKVSGKENKPQFYSLEIDQEKK